MTDFTKDFIEYGEKNKSQSKDIDLVMTKISQITDDPLRTSKSLRKNVCNLSHLSFINRYIFIGQPKKEDVFYNEIYKSPWASNIEVEDEHKNIFDSISNWYEKSRNSSSNKVDKILFILTMQILLLNTDDLKEQLKDKKYVDSQQQKYASMLHLYLKLHHPENYSTLLAKGLMLVHDTQRAHKLSIQKLNLF